VRETHENELLYSVDKRGIDYILHVNGVGPGKKSFRLRPEEDSGDVNDAIDIYSCLPKRGRNIEISADHTDAGVLFKIERQSFSMH
jgi:hypothetical protein